MSLKVLVKEQIKPHEVCTHDTTSGQLLTLIEVENTNHVFVEIFLRISPQPLDNRSGSRERKIVQEKKDSNIRPEISPNHTEKTTISKKALKNCNSQHRC